MIQEFSGPYGSTISLDLTEKLGEEVELEMFCFLQPPVEYRLCRDGQPICDWRDGEDRHHDLQRNALTTWRERESGAPYTDPPHRTDHRTFGVLSKGLTMESTGLCGTMRLMVWVRQGTYPEAGSCG